MASLLQTTVKEPDVSSGFPKGLFGGNTAPDASTNSTVRRLCCPIIFYVQLVVVSIIAIILIVRGFFLYDQNYYFIPEKWSPPLLAATGSAGLFALAWLQLSLCWPAWILPTTFFLSPVLFCQLSVMFFHTNSRNLGITALWLAIAQAFYVCWVYSRFPFGMRAIQKSCQIVPVKLPHLVRFIILGATLYSSLLVCGIGGAATANIKPKTKTTFFVMILLSLSWTLQVAKTMVHVSVARINFFHFTGGTDLWLNNMELREKLIYAMDDIVCGSVLIPLSGFVARVLKLINFSASSAAAMVLSRNTNRWGLVHVGVYTKSFIQSAADTWDSFRASEMGPLIDNDLTEVVCFFSGLSGGATAALVAGLYSAILTEELSLCAFLIGYFMGQIAVAWVQASVDAYYVAYVNHASIGRRANSIIAARLEELKLEQPLLAPLHSASIQ